MADLIDRTKAIKAIEDMQDCYNGFSSTFDKAQIIEVLEEVPTAERKGHWIHISTEADGNAYYQCSVCGKGECHVPIINVSYCWNCGARMDGEQ